MKITIIHGQNHKGSSYHIGKMLIDKIIGDKEVTEFFLPKDLNHFCVGCYQCIEDDTACPFYDEKYKIMNSVENSDLVIFTTPTYCMRASAPMKSLIDLTFTYWMSHSPRKCMFSKKAIVISTAAGMGSKTAIKDITNTMLYSGVPWIKSYGISVQAMTWKDVTDKKKKKIEKDMSKLARQVEKCKVPRVGLKTRILFNIMRIIQKAGWGASPLEKEYWNKNGWIEKSRPWKNY